jgi:hypothetical protein
MKKLIFALSISCFVQVLAFAQTSSKNIKLTYADSINSGLIKEDLKKAIEKNYLSCNDDLRNILEL